MNAKPFLLALIALIMAGSGFSQNLVITHIPNWGTTENLFGKVSGVNPSDYKVLAYLYFEGYWYVKPYQAAPLTVILADSTWACNVTTGGCDLYAARYAAFLVPDGFIVPGFTFQNQLPGELYQFPYDYRCRIPGSREISFSGLNWKVKGFPDYCPAGPNNNRWTDEENAVSVDGNGQLHLKIVFDSNSNRWKCTEVIADTSLGYGTYRFTIASRLDSLDRYVVFSPFVYDEYGDSCFYSEIDMEASRWGIETDPNFQYVIQPWNIPGNRHRFNVGGDTASCHQFTWKTDTVLFTSKKNDGTLIQSWDYTGSAVPDPGKENVRLNLWLNSATNTPANPSDTIEIVVKKFEFGNLLFAPVNVNASKGSYPDHVKVSWSPVAGAGYYCHVTNNMT